MTSIRHLNTLLAGIYEKNTEEKRKKESSCVNVSAKGNIVGRGQEEERPWK